MNDFDQLMAEIETEATASGPAAVAQMEAYRDQFRLASEIITLRLDAKMTQKQLADRSGVQQADISRIERGEMAPTGPTFGKLAQALGVGFGFYKPVKNGLAVPIRAAATNVKALATTAARGAGTSRRATGSRRSATAASSARASSSTRTTKTSTRSTTPRTAAKRTGGTRVKATTKKGKQSSARVSKSGGARGSSGRTPAR
jgi:transcriptional regulator with XRE-family HTH domain